MKKKVMGIREVVCIPFAADQCRSQSYGTTADPSQRTFIYCKCLAYCCQIYEASNIQDQNGPLLRHTNASSPGPPPMISNDDHRQHAKIQPVKTGEIGRHIF